MIRIANHNDAPRIVEMGAKFHAYSPWRDVPYDPVATSAFVGNVIETGAIFLTDEGMCGGTINPAYFNPAFRLAVEFFWWSPVRGEGRHLREAFEMWARTSGADAVQFSALADAHLPEVALKYERAGFRQAETAFIKRFA